MLLRLLSFQKLLNKAAKFKCKILNKIQFAKKFNQNTLFYRITKNSLTSNKLKNLLWLWKINKIYNKLTFFKNLKSLFFISINSINSTDINKIINNITKNMSLRLKTYVSKLAFLFFGLSLILIFTNLPPSDLILTLERFRSQADVWLLISYKWINFRA